jgi:hypothetical protein
MMTLAPALPASEYRAFMVYGHVPDGCIVLAIADEFSLPHLRPGEFVLVDTADTAPRNGEVFVIEWNSGRRNVCQARLASRRNPWFQEGVDTWMVGSITRPSIEALMAAPRKAGVIPTFNGWTEGPFDPDHLQEKLVGRVIGLFVERDNGPMRDITPERRAT